MVTNKQIYTSVYDEGIPRSQVKQELEVKIFSMEHTFLLLLVIQSLLMKTRIVTFLLMCHFFFSFFKDFIYPFLDTGEGSKKERVRKTNVWLPLAHPLLGTWPATQACSLTENRTYISCGSWAGAQSTEPHQPGLMCHFLMSTHFIERKEKYYCSILAGLT